MSTQKQEDSAKKTQRAPKDIYAMRKRKKRRKVLRQSIWMLMLAVTILVLYQRRDSWLPKLETIGVRHQSHRQEPDEQSGNFPIYIYGDNDFQMDEAGGRLMVLSDSYLFAYEPNGTLEVSRQHTYGNAMMQTAGDYVLLYESGGTHFRLETAAKTRFEKTLNDPIIFGRVSPNGLTAIVTGSDTCACKLLVYNLKGQQLYERDCVERLADFAFHPDEGGCYAAAVQTSGGGMKTVLHSYNFTDTSDIWSSLPLDMLAISVYNTSGGNIFVLGDTASCFLTAEGVYLNGYTYPDSLKTGCFSGETAALLLENSERRTESLVILSGSADHPVIRSFDKDVKDIGLLPESESVLVQLRKQFEEIGFNGSILSETPVSDSYDSFMRIGDRVFLRGYDCIGMQPFDVAG